VGDQVSFSEAETFDLAFQGAPILIQFEDECNAIFQLQAHLVICKDAGVSTGFGHEPYSSQNGL
jgi:hypothetical protein